MPYKDPEKRRKYHREYMRERYANDTEFRVKHLKNVKAWNDAYRQWWYSRMDEFCCIKCGEDDNACLDYHHRDPFTKEFVIADAIHRCWSKERIKAEIEKCDVLCSNCHRKLHRDLRNNFSRDGDIGFSPGGS